MNLFLFSSFLKLISYLKALGLISLQLTSYFFKYNFLLLHKLYLTFLEPKDGI